MAGVSRQQYATDIKLVRLMCTGRVDLAFILRAFSKGADGVFIGGCWPGECHYLTEGNYFALSTVHIARKLLDLIGVDPERVRLEWISASEGARFADVMNAFSKKLKEIGPLDHGDGKDGGGMRFKLDALRDLVPYIKLVERERLRVPLKSEQDYNQFFMSEEVHRLFKELIADKLAVKEIMLLLREGPQSGEDIADILGLKPAEVSKHVNMSARQGLVRFDERRRVMLAPMVRDQARA